MLKTIEAIYDNGKVIPIKDKINVKKCKILIIFLEDDSITTNYTITESRKFFGKIKNFTSESVGYQRKIRDEWDN